jgi:hypothetical protein
LKRAKIRFVAGSKAMLPLPVTKKENVLVSLGSICVVTLALGGAMQAPPGWPVVSQTLMLAGRATPPVSAEAVIDAPAPPTFTVATPKATLPFVVGMRAMPSFGGFVAIRATMSATAPAEDEINRVLTPTMIGAGLLLVQSKMILRSVEANAPLAVTEKT